MIAPSLIRFVVFAASLMAGSGCSHLSPGSATEWKSTMGMAPIFKYERDFKGIRVTDQAAKAADARLRIQILNFEYETTAKDVELALPPKPVTP